MCATRLGCSIIGWLLSIKKQSHAPRVLGQIYSLASAVGRSGKALRYDVFFGFWELHELSVLMYIRTPNEPKFPTSYNDFLKLNHIYRSQFQ